MKHILWKSLLALTFVVVTQAAHAVVDITTINTPGLTNKGSLEPFSTPEVTFTNEAEQLYYRIFRADFASPINTFGLRWSVGEPEGIEGYEFQDWISNVHPAFDVKFIDDEGVERVPVGSGEGETAGSAYTDVLYTSVRFSVFSPRASYLDTLGNQVIIGHPVNISQVVFGVDRSLLIPEPETYAMIASGLGVLGWVARRRKHVEIRST